MLLPLNNAAQAAALLDEVRRDVVESYFDVAASVIAEYEDAVASLPADSPEVDRLHDVRVWRLKRYRAAVVELYDAATFLRLNDGIGQVDLSDSDEEVTKAYGVIRSGHAATAAEDEAKAAEQEAFDAALERFEDGLFDYANGEGPGPWFASPAEGGAA